MQNVKFERDSKKDAVNKRKRGVGFNEAVTFFEDEFAEICDDDEHPATEARYMHSGNVFSAEDTCDYHTERINISGNAFVNRIISARKAMKKEYDFSKMKSRPNPYALMIKRQITIRINPNTIDYLKCRR